MFEKAVKNKYRFNSEKGLLSVEQLFDLPLEGAVSLNAIAKELNRNLKSEEEESFVSIKTKFNQLLVDKFELVKYIIKIKLEERSAIVTQMADKEHNQKILSLIAKKEAEEEEGLSIEELKAKLK